MSLCFSFLKLENRRVEQVCCLGRLVLGEAGGGGERMYEGKYGEKYCVHMYVDGKMIYLLNLFQECVERRIRENGGGGEFKYDIFDIL
jgi:hypothetical protein